MSVLLENRPRKVAYTRTQDALDTIPLFGCKRKDAIFPIRIADYFL